MDMHCCSSQQPVESACYHGTLAARTTWQPLMWMHCRPYDTLEEVFGVRGMPGHGSLREWGVHYRDVPLTEAGLLDWPALQQAITPSEPWRGHFMSRVMQSPERHARFVLPLTMVPNPQLRVLPVGAGALGGWQLCMRPWGMCLQAPSWLEGPCTNCSCS